MLKDERNRGRVVSVKGLRSRTSVLTTHSLWTTTPVDASTAWDS